jgi:hypothetical protein
MRMCITYLAAVLPLWLTLHITQQILSLMTVMSLLLICALFLLSSFLLLFVGVRNVVRRIHTRVFELHAPRISLATARVFADSAVNSGCASQFQAIFEPQRGRSIAARQE